MHPSTSQNKEVNEKQREECKQCGKSFDTLAKLKRHLPWHKRLEVTDWRKCFYCKEQMQNYTVFTDHVENNHKEYVLPTNGKNKEYKCAECDSRYARIRYLDTHYRNKHIGGTGYEISKCRYCSAPFYDSFEKNTHERTHLDSEGNIHFNCHECTMKFESAEPFAAHYNEHYMSRPSVCRYCPRRFKLAGMVLQHEKKKHAGELFSKNTETPDGLSTIERRMIELRSWQDQLMPGPVRNEDNELAFICRLCGEQVYGEEKFQYHLKKHNERYKCDSCGYRTHTLNHYTRHLKIHLNSGERPFICEMCGVSFREPEHLKTHSIVHQRTKHCKCEECGQEFEDEYSYQHHLNTVHGGKHKCSFCTLKFISALARKQHEQNSHPDVLGEECNICGEKFKFFISLGNHMKLHEAKEQKCPQCSQELPDEYSLIEHANAEHDGKAYKCERCDGVYRTKNDLRGHFSFVHKEKLPTCRELLPDGLTRREKDIVERYGYMDQLTTNRERNDKNKLAFVCKHCKMKIFGITKFRIHLVRHGEGKYKCNICGHCAYTRTLHQKHMETHDDTIRHVCDHCGMSFSILHRFTSHLKVHKNKKKCKCRQCGKRFEDEFTYKLHRREIHSKPVKCQFCDSQFQTEGLLAQHEKENHYDNLPFTCKNCNERFRSKITLSNHMKMHEPKRETCLDCHEEYPDEYSFNKHIKEHVNCKPFECPLCGLRLRSKANVERHMRRMHSESDEEQKNKNEEINETNEDDESDFDSDDSTSDIEEEAFEEQMDISDSNLEQEYTRPPVEITPLPFSVALTKELLKNNYTCCLVWTKNLEADLATIAAAYPKRCYICVTNAPKELTIGKNTELPYGKVFVSINLQDNSNLQFTLLSFQNQSLNSVEFDSLSKFEDSLKESSNQTNIVHFSRQHSKSHTLLAEETEARVVTCNCV